MARFRYNWCLGMEVGRQAGRETNCHPNRSMAAWGRAGMYR